MIKGLHKENVMKKFSIVSIYSLIHCIVDMSCAMLIAGIITPASTGTTGLLISIFLYNLFAFAFQLPFGIIADKLNKNALVSAIGCLFIIVAYFVSSFGILACIIAGIGNALFHIGGGIDVLNISDKKATLPGIYVATGAMGLYIGSNCVYLGIDKFYFIAIILAISAISLFWLYKLVKEKYIINNEEPEFKDISSKEQIIMYCILITICIRGYLGLILNFKWKSNFFIGLIVVSAVVLGKILGGIIGDKFGWKKTSTVSLVISAILFIFAFDSMICGIIAILLFNMTMPITLTALSNMFYKNKGMAFGMTTLALFIGAVPVLLGYREFLFDKISLFIITIISAAVLYFGLNKYETLENKND